MKRGLGHPERREALFGGVGEVLVWNLLGDVDFPPFTAVLACELAPGGRVGAHRQERDPEVVIVTEGEGTAEVDGEVYSVSTGTVITLALGDTVSLANDSQEHPLRYLIVKAALDNCGAPPSEGEGR